MQSLNLTQNQADGEEHTRASHQGVIFESQGQPPVATQLTQEQQILPTMTLSAGVINGLGNGGAQPRNPLLNGIYHGQWPQQPPRPPSHFNIMQTSLLGMPPSSNSLGPGDMTIFDNTFMDLGSEFDPSTLFRPDGDINFERDFGQWFNPDDTVMGASLDMH